MKFSFRCPPYRRRVCRLAARWPGSRDYRRAVGHGNSCRCSASELSGTVSSATGAARAYLASHPGADPAVTTAFSQPRAQAAATLRGYFTANPGEYNDLRAILSPIGDKQRQCNVAVLPPDLASAYSQFMAG